jgi:SagB-type dehydrogenase family enzyme
MFLPGRHYRRDKFKGHSLVRLVRIKVNSKKEDAMIVKKTFTGTLIITTLFFYSTVTGAQETKVIKLLGQRAETGVTLVKALQERKSVRDFNSEDLPLQILSDLLWAANGINRPDSGLRTAPSAMNMQEIDVYVAKADGLYLYDAKAHTLTLLLQKDIRALTGNQPFVKTAPINLIFVADYSKMGKLSGSDADFYAATDTGFVSENVYLYCASVGLATVVRGWVDKAALAKAMNLRSDQKIILAQTVGYPAK